MKDEKMVKRLVSRDCPAEGAAIQVRISGGPDAMTAFAEISTAIREMNRRLRKSGDSGMSYGILVEKSAQSGASARKKSRPGGESQKRQERWIETIYGKGIVRKVENGSFIHRAAWKKAMDGVSERAGHCAP